jgi:RNA polymerase sigma factor (sigma-70 family)
MTTTTHAAPIHVPDEQLWQQSRAGNREAFRHIVERYQSLVCSLAYSASGSLSRSEDLAQETFVTAWQRLGDLREPAKLRAWLCGIVRNLAANASRREQRRGGPVMSLDSVPEEATPDADPAAHAVTKEEAALLWNSLGSLPAAYREPLVLFYRQGQSIAEVATSLDLSEDVVKQRLSRGRVMLREEMISLVESTLSRSRPGSAFTMGVLVALPMLSASTASLVLATGSAAGAGAGASTAGKSVLAKLGLGVFVGPVIGLLFAYWGTKAAASTARSSEERAIILRYTRYGIIAFCLVMVAGLVGILSQAGKLYAASALWVLVGVSAWTAALVGGILLICGRMDREVARIRSATNTTDDDYARVLAANGKQLRLPRYFESKARLFGLPLFAMAWGGNNSVERRTRAVCAWIAVGDIAISPLIAFGGLAVAPVAIGAISVGILGLSVFWGVAFGVFALGSLAFGWWAIGCAALGVKCAVGFAAVARDYAVGLLTTGTEAGTATAKEWVTTRWFADFEAVMVDNIHWWIVTCMVVVVVLRIARRPQEDTQS